MPYELAEIKKIRKSLGLTQTDLAKRADVSQSLIAKIESEKIDPTFTKTKKIFVIVISTLNYIPHLIALQIHHPKTLNLS